MGGVGTLEGMTEGRIGAGATRGARMRAWMDERRDELMAGVALAFLVLLAALIPHGGMANRVAFGLIETDGPLALLLVLWAAIAAEAGWEAWRTGGRRAWASFALIALIPPMRLTVAPARDAVRLPFAGMEGRSKEAVAAVESRAAMPMLAITALIVPVILVDVLVGPKPHDVLAERLVEVDRAYAAGAGRHVFLLDADKRVIAHFEGGRERRDLLYAENDAGTRLRLTGGTARLTTRCEVSTGTLVREGDVLRLPDGLRKVSRCAPSGLEIAMWAVTALIWLSFALEFIVLCSLAPKRLEFVKKHWINLVIILLPLLAFLRSLRLLRLAQLTKATKLTKAYRLRGLFARLVKLAMLFNLVDRFMSRNPERHRAHLEEKAREAREALAGWEAKLAGLGDDKSGQTESK